MKPQGIRDIIGPIMIGPSSSHTAGALRIASMARGLLKEEPSRVTFTLYGSFSRTWHGHGTDKALVAGILGMDTDDKRVRTSFDVAREEGLDFRFIADTKTKTSHPNTVDIDLLDRAGARVRVRGVSVGGGAAQIRAIDGVEVNITGEYTNLIIRLNDTPGVLAYVSTSLAESGVNIGNVRMYRKRRGEECIAVIEADEDIPQDVQEEIALYPPIISVRVVPQDAYKRHLVDNVPTIDVEEAPALFYKLNFSCAEAVLAYCAEHACTICEAFYAREEPLLALSGKSIAGTEKYLDKVLQVMRESVHPDGRPTMGGLIGSEACALDKLAASGGGFGTQIARLSSYAVGVLETNASMGRIVAAPTAGSSGVLPAVLLTLQDMYALSDMQLKGALVNAAAIGQLIVRNATVAGAEGGCQAEIGSASAMAASAAVELMGGTPQACFDAASIALANTLGLVCDPIGGLVEAPCQKRNAAGAANALVSAEMALAGIKADAPFDEVVEVMAKVGRSIPYELRETALGGMATCPSCMKCAKDRP